MRDKTIDKHSHNRVMFEQAETVAAYASAEGLRNSERVLFDEYISTGTDILDLGVGGGRTTPYLRAKAKIYLGVDYSPTMIEACQRKFPECEFRILDVCNMSCFNDRSFDVIVFSFNGLACLHPDEARLRCLAECSRILRDGGVLLFSLPNPKSLFVRPTREGRSLRQTVAGATAAIRINMARIVGRAIRAPFWRGNGYAWTNAHGGLYRYLAVPKKVSEEMDRFGFDLLAVCHEDTPKPHIRYASRWYDYAFRKRG